MTQYAIYLPTPAGYEHNNCFLDQAIPLQRAFADLGYDVPITRQPIMGVRNIVLGAHLLPMVDSTYADLVLYNLEQIAPDVPWITQQYVDLLKRYPVWDYSIRNLQELAKLGVEAKLLPVAYHECMRTIKHQSYNNLVAAINDGVGTYKWPMSLISEEEMDKASATKITGIPTYYTLSGRVWPEPEPGMKVEDKTIDVLHYGSMNERRQKLLGVLENRGIKVKHLFGVYGEQRDRMISRARLVLNISYYEGKIFNITRCSTLFANSIPVVSEIGLGGEAFHDTGGFAHYDELPGLCMKLLKRGASEAGRKGFEIYSNMPNLTTCLRNILAPA